MPQVDFIPFADDPGANVEDQADYAASPTTATGFAAGLAQSAPANKAWRQATTVASAVANFIANQLNEDVLDNGDLATLITQLTSAIAAAATPSTYNPTRLYTLNIALALDPVTDYAVGVNQAVAGAFQITLPTAAAVGKEYVIEDVKGTMFANNVTVVDQAALPISNEASYIMNQNYQSARFRKYGGLWSVAS